jgi:hypothetical protein
MAAVMNLSGRPTSHAAFMTILAENAAPEAPQDPAALDQFLQWKSEITRAASGPLLLCLGAVKPDWPPSLMAIASRT